MQINVFSALLTLIVAVSAALFVAVAAQDSTAEQPKQPNIAFVLEINDAIGPATSDFFVRTLADANERKASLVILQMDTPGGLDSAMRDMIRAILASHVPVVTYVAPSGARAASAGTYLLFASHIAAMAPATNLGAATPVQIGGSPGEPRDQPQDKREDGDAPKPDSAMERKAVNDAIAYIRGLAELRGRNGDWAEEAVRSAASLSASAALEKNVIEVIAADTPDLLNQIDGRMVTTSSGKLRLTTENMVIERVEADWRTRLLAVLTNPNVAYLLMLIGIYGLLLEGYSPGAIVPGVVGAISLLLALYAFQVLSVNYAGLGLMILGIALIIAEAFAPSFGTLGLGGITAFVFGSIILLDTDVPGFQVARSVIGGIALAGAIVMFAMVMLFARSRRRPVETGQHQLLHSRAVAIDSFDSEGWVRVHGELWRAHSSVPVHQGQVLRIVRIEGLMLEVIPDA